jgi:hypothetical protein
MKTAKILIETGPRGVQSVTVRVPRGERQAGFGLLKLVLPVIGELNRSLQTPQRAVDNKCEEAAR